MMLSRLFLVCLILLQGSYAHAQKENWDTYMALYDGKPGSVLVDMEFANTAPEKLLPYLVLVGPKAKNCSDSQGIPSAEEIEELEQVLSVTGGVLSGATARKLVGTFTYNCERLNYYYVRDTDVVRSAIHRVYANHFHGFEYSLSIKYDPNWLAYRTFLFPDSTAQEWMATNRIITGMLAAGDKLDTPRKIYHSLYFLTETDRAAFAKVAVDSSYEVSSVGNARGISSLYEITVTQFGKVRMNSIMMSQGELKRLAAPFRGNYKSWEAPLH